MTSHQHAPLPLDQLEFEVLARICAHRQARRGALPVGLFVTLTALAAGVVMGLLQPPHNGAIMRGSEMVVLADDARLAPSTLLTASQ